MMLVREGSWKGCGVLERLTVRPSARAAVGVVAEGVDVHPALCVGVVACDVPGDGGLSILGRLLEGYGALDIGVSTEDGDWRWLLAFDSVEGTCVQVGKAI